MKECTAGDWAKKLNPIAIVEHRLAFGDVAVDRAHPEISILDPQLFQDIVDSRSIRYIEIESIVRAFYVLPKVAVQS
jgi:hypothetical protein